jgi:hypothetical protein
MDSEGTNGSVADSSAPDLGTVLMSAAELLIALRNRGLTVAADGDALTVRPRDLKQARRSSPSCRRYRSLLLEADGRRREVCCVPPRNQAEMAECYPNSASAGGTGRREKRSQRHRPGIKRRHYRACLHALPNEGWGARTPDRSRSICESRYGRSRSAGRHSRRRRPSRIRLWSSPSRPTSQWPQQVNHGIQAPARAENSENR